MEKWIARKGIEKTYVTNNHDTSKLNEKQENGSEKGEQVTFRISKLAPYLKLKKAGNPLFKFTLILESIRSTPH